VLSPAADGEGAHRKRQATESLNFLCGMDFGIRGDGVVLWSVHGRDGALYLLDECIAPGLTIYQFADIILTGHIVGAQSENRPVWPPPKWVGCDPAGNSLDHHGKTCTRTLRDHGILPKFGRGPLQEGLEHIRARLRPADGSPPRLFVHERCVKLIEAMTRYHYPEEKPESLVPVKDGFDHPVDALRYLVKCVDGLEATASSNYMAQH
jgi:hypothetical protein